MYSLLLLLLLFQPMFIWQHITWQGLNLYLSGILIKPQHHKKDLICLPRWRVEKKQLLSLLLLKCRRICKDGLSEGSVNSNVWTTLMYWRMEGTSHSAQAEASTVTKASHGGLEHPLAAYSYIPKTFVAFHLAVWWFCLGPAVYSGHLALWEIKIQSNR